MEPALEGERLRTRVRMRDREMEIAEQWRDRGREKRSKIKGWGGCEVRDKSKKKGKTGWKGRMYFGA